MTLSEKIERATNELLVLLPEDRGDFARVPDGPLSSTQVEDVLVRELVLRHPGIETLSPLKQENLLLADVISDLGFSPHLVRETTASPAGEVETFVMVENEALKGQLARLLSPLRSTDPRVIAEIIRETPPNAIAQFLQENVFPDAAINRDPTGFNIIGDLFTPIIGLSERQIQNLPAASRPVVRAIQTTFLSPGGLLTAFFLPGAIGGLRIFGPDRALGRIARFLFGGPKNAARTQFVGEVFGEAARELGAPVPIQVGIQALAGLVSGNVFDEIAELGARRAARTFIQGDVAAGDLALPRTQADLEDILANFTEEQLDDLSREVLRTAITEPDLFEGAEGLSQGPLLDPALAAPVFSALSSSQDDALRQSAQFDAQERADVERFHRQALSQFARQRELEAEAARIASAQTNNLQGREQDFRDVDEFEHQQRARLADARLAGQDQPVLAPRPTEPRRISNTARVDEGFGFGTRGANALAEARERQQQERARLATLPPSARGIGETDLAAEQRVSSQRPSAATTPSAQQPFVLPPSARGVGATDLAAEVAAETELARARQAEARASAARQATETAAAQAEAEVEASREAVRNAPTAREAVDRMDTSRDADARAARLRESAEIAAEEEKMLRDIRQRAQRLANQALAERRRREAEALAAAQEAARTEERRRNALALAAANTREVSSTSPFAS